MSKIQLRPVPYRRMSTDHQDNSPARQAEVISDWSNMHGIPLIEPKQPFLDEAVTGTTNDRYHLKRLIDTGAQLGANAVAIDQMSRISRTDALEAAAEVYLPLRQAGLRYIVDCSKNTVHDLFDTNCILFVTIEQGHGSNAESKNIAHRAASGIKTLREQGYFFGPKPPYGYRKIHRRKNKYGQPGCGKLEPIAEKVPEIQNIFNRYEKLRSARKVAQEVGVPTRVIEKILNQPVYCGRLVTKPLRTVAKFESMTGPKMPGEPRMVFRTKEEIEYRESVYPKIIEPEQYDRCQAIMKLNRKGDMKRKHRGFKYKDKVYCLHCGCPMHGQLNGSKRSNHTKVVYLCDSSKHPERNVPAGHERCTKAKRIRESLIDEAVDQCMGYVEEAIGQIEDWRKAAEEGWQEVQLWAHAEQKKIEAELASIQAKKAQAARSLLILADAQPEIIDAAKQAYAELIQEEKTIAAKASEVANIERTKKDYHNRTKEMWDAMLNKHVLELIERISIRFEPEMRKSPRWKNDRGEQRGGWMREWQVAVSCLIEFKTWGQPGQEQVFPYVFARNEIVETAQHSLV